MMFRDQSLEGNFSETYSRSNKIDGREPLRGTIWVAQNFNLESLQGLEENTGISIQMVYNCFFINKSLEYRRFTTLHPNEILAPCLPRDTVCISLTSY